MVISAIGVPGLVGVLMLKLRLPLFGDTTVLVCTSLVVLLLTMLFVLVLDLLFLSSSSNLLTL